MIFTSTNVKVPHVSDSLVYQICVSDEERRTWKLAEEVNYDS